MSTYRGHFCTAAACDKSPRGSLMSMFDATINILSSWIWSILRACETNQLGVNPPPHLLSRLLGTQVGLVLVGGGGLGPAGQLVLELAQALGVVSHRAVVVPEGGAVRWRRRLWASCERQHPRVLHQCAVLTSTGTTEDK